MSGAFNRDQLPNWQAYGAQFGYSLEGRGLWRTTRCDLHGGSDSLRVNVERGAWVCMACGAKGGDVLAHHLAVTGAPFVQAARDLGAWDDAAAPAAAHPRPRRFSASDALSVLASEVAVCMVVIADARQGLTPNDSDWQRFLQAARRIELISSEVRS